MTNWKSSNQNEILVGPFHCAAVVQLRSVLVWLCAPWLLRFPLAFYNSLPVRVNRRSRCRRLVGERVPASHRLSRLREHLLPMDQILIRRIEARRLHFRPASLLRLHGDGRQRRRRRRPDGYVTVLDVMRTDATRWRHHHRDNDAGDVEVRREDGERERLVVLRLTRASLATRLLRTLHAPPA